MVPKNVLKLVITISYISIWGSHSLKYDKQYQARWKAWGSIEFQSMEVYNYAHPWRAWSILICQTRGEGTRARREEIQAKEGYDKSQEDHS